MPTPPAYRQTIEGRLVTVANRIDRKAREKYVEVHIYAGPDMTGEPEHDLEYDYRVFGHHHAEVARLAFDEFGRRKRDT